jgi:hypothetical protein
VARSVASRPEHLLALANKFLDEVRDDVGRARSDGSDTPPRLRLVHERPGHATPEFRTLNIPVPESAGGASPEVLSGLIARYARERLPQAVMLALELQRNGSGGEPETIVVAEARNRPGIRLFWVQPYALVDGTVEWGEPEEGGWQDPGKEEMILDATFGGEIRRG